MPLYSMTGFGQAEKETPSGTFKVDVRSVNNRFIETQIRLPKPLLGLDQRIRKELGSNITRGSVTINVSWSSEAGDDAIAFDMERIAQYVEALKKVKKKFSLQDDVKLDHLLMFQDLFKNGATVVEEEAIWKQLKPVLLDALNNFVDSRKSEGEFIGRELKKMVGDIVKHLTQVEKQAPIRLKKYTRELKARIESMTNTAVDPARLAQEVAFLGDKLDIQEECTRLRAHIEKMTEEMDGDGPVGKKLGFILQEMNREATTIGSKANDTKISHLSVSLKDIIEKIREQIQNIE